MYFICEVRNVESGTKTLLIALGAALLVIVLVPAIFMGICMATGINMGGMMGGDSTMHNMSTNMLWVMGGFALVIVIAGIGLLMAGLKRGTPAR